MPSVFAPAVTFAAASPRRLEADLYQVCLIIVEIALWLGRNFWRKRAPDPPIAGFHALPPENVSQPDPFGPGIPQEPRNSRSHCAVCANVAGPVRSAAVRPWPPGVNLRHRLRSPSAIA